MNKYGGEINFTLITLYTKWDLQFAATFLYDFEW